MVVQASILGLFFSLILACGGVSGETPNEDPGPSPGRNIPQKLNLVPSLTHSNTLDDNELNQLTIAHLAVSLHEVRLVGEDPKIPAGGVELLTHPQVITWDNQSDVASGLELSLPLVAGKDAALFVRIGPSVHLDGASVEISAELSKSPESLLVPPSPSLGAEFSQTSSVSDTSATSSPHGRLIRGAVNLEENQVKTLQLTLQEYEVVDIMLPIGLRLGGLDTELTVPFDRWFTAVIWQYLQRPVGELELTFEDGAWRFLVGPLPEDAERPYELRLKPQVSITED